MIRRAGPDIPEMLDELRALVNKRNRRSAIKLEVPEDSARESEGFVTFLVFSKTAGVSALAIVEQLEKLEKEFKKKTGAERVMLLPAYGD